MANSCAVTEVCGLAEWENGDSIKYPHPGVAPPHSNKAGGVSAKSQAYARVSDTPPHPALVGSARIAFTLNFCRTWRTKPTHGPIFSKRRLLSKVNFAAQKGLLKRFFKMYTTCFAGRSPKRHRSRCASRKSHLRTQCGTEGFLRGCEPFCPTCYIECKFSHITAAFIGTLKKLLVFSLFSTLVPVRGVCAVGVR